MRSSRSFLAAALALLITNENFSVVHSTTFVCGSDYNEASMNCKANPTCGTGDQCPPEKSQCYAMPDENCFSPPSASPTVTATTGAPTMAPLRICGLNFEDAMTNCRTNNQCPGGDNSLCPPQAACFSIPVDQCPTDAPTMMPTPAPKVCGSTYGDAVTNCLNEEKRCPTGDGCEMGEACFNVPTNVCVAPAPTTPAPVKMDVLPPAPTPVPSVKPVDVAITVTPVPTEPKVPTAPTEPPVPTRMDICGTTYGDAIDNYCSNTRCPTGDGCAPGETCFALAYTECPADTTPSPTPVGQTKAPTTSPVTPNPSMSPTTSSPTTSTPSKSPVFNKFFCGATYQLAEANCVTAEPCPSGSGCSIPGEACFGISTEKCLSQAPTNEPTGTGPQPTDSPTTSKAPTSKPVTGMPTVSPTPSPSKSPIVNTYFCGATYGEAVSTCSEATACPSGICANGQNCYPNINCAAPVTTNPPVVTTPGQPTTGQPTLAPADKPSFVDWLNFNNATVNRHYCGTSLEDAMERCATTISCASADGNGDSSVCLPPQSCFLIPEPCGSSDSGAAPTDQQTPPSPTIFDPSPPSVTPPTPNPVEVQQPTAPFDPSITSYCGVDYTDALMNCYKKTPCPTNEVEACPNGEQCFPGIMNCETPNPTISPSPTLVGGPGSTLSPTGRPTKRPTTPQPTWNLDFTPTGGASRSYVMLGLKTLLMGGILGAALL